MHAMLLTTYVVTPGNTLSGIAASHSVSLAAVEAANPQIVNPNLIYVGETVFIPGSLPSQAPVSQVSQAPVSQVSPSNLGAPGSFQACVIQRESGGDAQVMNSSGHYGLYQFSESTWVEAGGNPADFGHASVSEQNQVFNSAYALWGVSPWQPYDGCS
jgi:LysM repeat protein